RLRTHPQSSFDPSPVHPSPPSSLTPTRPPPTSPLFPYTTLFRSHPPLPTSNDRGRRDVDGLAAPGAGHQRRCDRREDLTRLLHYLTGVADDAPAPSLLGGTGDDIHPDALHSWNGRLLSKPDWVTTIEGTRP